MNLGELWRRLDRVQRSFAFKVAVTAVVVLLGIGGLAAYIVHQQANADPGVRSNFEEMFPRPPDDADPQIKEQWERVRFSADAMAKATNAVLRGQGDPTAVAVGVTLAVAVTVAVVWIGLGLWSLGLLLVLSLVAGPLIVFGSGGWQDLGRFVAAAGALTFSFLVLMELLKAAFSGPFKPLAIARNVVLEAVRMKVSVVFIVLLVIVLAALPEQLDPERPLRYRVQSFLQYGVGATFWITAILTLFLAVGSVAFEQRDKVIWQTMTKPVAAWQYLLGKWLGVVGVAAVLLGVSASGVFLFVGYLREQPAIGEVRAFVPRGNELVTDDRWILETQVLTARRSVMPTLPRLDPSALSNEVDQRAERARKADPSFRDGPEERQKILNELLNEVQQSYLSIGPGEREVFRFPGLREVRERGLPVTLRYRVNAGANDPRATYRVTFFLPNAEPVIQEIPLGQTLTIRVSPASINAEGVLEVLVVNGDAARRTVNEETITFPPDGLEVYYPVSSYRMNYLRVVGVLWLKLAFLAMVGICAATHLSFSVSCLVAFGVFLMAESASFLVESLEYYESRGNKDEILWGRVLIRTIAVPVAYGFKFYAELRPSSHLVEGKLLDWGTVSRGVGVLFVLTASLFAVAVSIFRKRELATYSGQ